MHLGPRVLTLLASLAPLLYCISFLGRLREYLNIFPGNFLQQLDNFKVSKVHAWADSDSDMQKYLAQDSEPL